MDNRTRVAWYVSLALLLILTACKPQQDAVAPLDPYKVAFIYLGSPGDLGWTYQHDQGRQWLETALGQQVQTETFETLNEGAEVARLIRQLAQEDYAIIFATSSDYANAMYEVAQEFPHIKFESCAGDKVLDNLGTYTGRMYQPRYLSGIVAGRITQNNVIGYVASFPTPEVIRGINAFTLGARSVNPNTEVRVAWTLTRYNPDNEREAAISLLDQGADIITQHQDSIEPQKAAQERGAFSIGYDSDLREFVGDTVLTSPVWNWGVYYVDTVQSAIDGTWQSQPYWGEMKDGVVMLADFSPKVPQEVQAQVKAAQDKIFRGEDVFCGPIRDQSGNTIVAAGACMDDEAMRAMRFFVEGVVGTIPEE